AGQPARIRHQGQPPEGQGYSGRQPQETPEFPQKLPERPIPGVRPSQPYRRIRGPTRESRRARGRRNSELGGKLRAEARRKKPPEPRRAETPKSGPPTEAEAPMQCRRHEPWPP